jgi:hypothetical protein
MITHPPEFSELISTFVPKFSKKVFEHVGQLLLGTMLTNGKRTVCAVLRTVGLSGERNWHKYHRVLSRAKWSALQCSQVLLQLLLQRLLPGEKELVFVIDETLERRWGPRIRARGIYRDAVRSSQSHFVKCSGLRWMCLMLLAPVGWAGRNWALPFLTALCPSERYHREKGKKHKKLTDFARQMALQLSRWLRGFKLVIVGDTTYSCIELLASTLALVTWVTRLRVDAALYDPAHERLPGSPGRPPQKGKRQPTLSERLKDPATKWQQVCFSQWYGEQNKAMEVASGTAVWYHSGKPIVPLRWVLVSDPAGKLDPVALQCTDLEMTPADIVGHFVKRWQVEVTFEEVRAHLGVETQRQWSDLSIARSTPVLMALFSVVTLWADQLFKEQKLTTFSTAWYFKPNPTFSDALASVRYRFWRFQHFCTSVSKTDMQKHHPLLIEHLCFMAARAA